VQDTEDAFLIPHRARPLTRMIARAFDAYDSARAQHSSAI
jgi:oxygen-independent coproporphyrinogen-3 oxidase